ncbi:hypothetical protein T10_13253 [Trichinella papuae]|uniref:Uncharacterized protein n=1 Tax=Trichinella papuae TaxID=268474 RepID=A0A0V1MCR4_9BILA|nr:hypothetical protein T10_13253 [Trichinella papuae]
MKFISIDTTRNAPFIGEKCNKNNVKKSLDFVKLLQPIIDFSAARYSAHFDTKIGCLVIFLASKRLLCTS